MSRPPPDPPIALDDQRCDTRALDVGAVRAIHAAYVSGTGQSSGAGAAPPAIEPSAEDERASAEREAPPSAPAPRPADDGALDRDERPLSERPWVDAAEHSDAAARPAPQVTTIEIDYSPASRLARERSIKVQRIARAVVAGCMAAAVLLGAWALVRASRAPLAPGQVPVTAQQSAPMPGEPAASALPTTAETASGAPAATAAVPSSSAPVAAASTNHFSYAPTQGPNTPPPSRASGAPAPQKAPSSWPGPRPAVTPVPPGTDAPPVPGPPAAPLPGGTVDLPIPE